MTAHAPDPANDAHPGPGLVLEEREATPHVSPVGVAASAGLLWGLLGYAILWEGEPVTVQRPFVQSAAGTLALLPIRIVLWSIHLAESLAGRSFDLSSNHWWLGALAGAIGLGTTSAVFLLAGATVRRLRRHGRRGSIPA